MKKFQYKLNFRVISFMISDLFFVIFSLAVSGYIFKSLEIGPKLSYGAYLDRMVMFIPEGLVFLLIFILLNFLFGLYSSLWKYAGATELITLFMVLVLEFTILLFASRAMDIQIPLYTFPMCVLICFFLMTVSRMWYRLVIRSKQILFSGNQAVNAKRVMVVGVGDAGAMLIRAMTHDPRKRGYPVVLVDDDPHKQKMQLLGIPVAGTRYDIPKLAKDYSVDRIIIAIPSINTVELKELLDICADTGCEVLKSDIAEIFNDSLESSANLVSSDDPAIPAIRLETIKPEDLLGREAVNMDIDAAARYLTGKTVLVSGGAGSIGSEICRQACRLNPKHIIVYDMDENNSYSLSFEIGRAYPKQKFTLVIGSVRDEEKLMETFEKFKPDVVFHAAAHKHVPLMENDPEEAIKNNVFGTYNLCNAAIASCVQRFILISTDKAVNPTNVMGASKRMCEYVIKGMNDRVKHLREKDPDSKVNTVFAAVRFGNVLGSNGSVIPLFKKQLAEGGPITITDKRMTRYFMIIPEAAKLVIEAGAMATGGEIFILDMGTPVKIDDMARNMIRLAGLKPDIDIKIEYIGLRPGEKLYEELTMEYENVEKTKHNKIKMAKDDFMTFEKLEGRIAVLQEALKARTNIRDAIKTVVPTYKPESES